MAGVALLFYGATVSRHLLLPDSAILIDAMRDAEISSNVCSHNLTQLLGWLFQQLPLANLALKGSLMSVFCGSVVIGLFHALLRSIGLPRPVAVLGTLVLMVSHSLWWHSTIVENYALSNIFLVSCLLLAAHAVDAPRRWYLLCYLAGLAMFNHLQNGALAIGLAAFYLASAPLWQGYRWQRFWRGFALYLLGAAPYFMVVAHDLLHCDNVQDTLHWAVGGGFTTIMFQYNWTRALTRLADWIFQQFPSPFLLFIPLGFAPLLRRRGLAAFMLGVMATNLTFFLGYETWDQFAFYLELFVCLGALGALGAAWCWQRFNRVGRLACGALLAISFLIPPLVYPQIPSWAARDSGYWSRRYHSASVAYAGRYDLVGIYADLVRHDRGTVEQLVQLLFAKLPPHALLIDDVSVYYQVKFFQDHNGQRPDLRLLLLQPLNMEDWGTPASEIIDACRLSTNKIFITATNGPNEPLMSAFRQEGWRAEQLKLADDIWIYELRH